MPGPVCTGKARSAWMTLPNAERVLTEQEFPQFLIGTLHWSRLEAR